MIFDNTLQLYNRLESDPKIQNFIAQANSRYILYNVNETESNYPKYTENLDERCLSIAVNYLSVGYSLYKDNIAESIKCLEKAAILLEHIFANSNNSIRYKEYYCLVAALGYYAASQYSKAFVILRKLEVDTVIAMLIQLFLTKQFKELQKTIDSLLIQKQNVYEVDNEEVIIIEILARYFIEILTFTYSGEQTNLDNAKEIMDDLITLASINEDPALWWVFRLLKLVSNRFENSSLWKTIRPLFVEDYELVEKYIVSNVYKELPVTELFKSQIDCLEQIKSDLGAVVSIPTSSGKTKLAEIAILNNYLENPDSISLYIAPFRSLAYEIEESLSSTLGAIGFSLSHLYGGAQYTQLDRALVEDANIIIATPEKAKAIFRSNADIINKVKLVIVDEGHLIGNQNRYITSELFIEELKVSLRENGGKIILLSAVLPNLKDFSRWITGDENQIAKSKWRPASQRFGVLELVKNSVNLVWLGNYESYNKKFVEKKLVKAKRVTCSGKEYPAKYFPETKKDAIAATAMKLLNLGSILIFVGKSNMVNSQARVFYQLMEEQNISHKWSNFNDFELLELACNEAYGTESEILKYAKVGVICHSAKLPTDVRMCMERLMNNGEPKIVIATTTLAQGVNIGVSTVIISNVYYDSKKTIDVKDFWNIAGRAGRAFVDTEGKILYAIDKSPKKEQWQINNQINQLNKYLKSSNMEKVVSGVFGLLEELYNLAIDSGIDYETFLEMIAENDYSILDNEEGLSIMSHLENKLDLLDDTLLSMNVKCSSSGVEDKSMWIDDCFRQSLAYISAQNNATFEEEKVIEILKARNSGVLKLAGHPSSWASLTNSSVTLRVNIEANTILDELYERVSAYLSTDGVGEVMLSLIEYLDELIIKLPTLDIRDYSNCDSDISTVRRMWFKGMAMKEIIGIDDKSSDICNKYYGFHFPWIVNALGKKMKSCGYEDEAKILEDIALLAEIGVPDNSSAKIYLSGIRSRESAVEISAETDINNDDSLESVKEKLFHFNANSSKYSFSEQTFKWLNIINRKNQYKKKIEIRRSRVRFLNSEFDNTKQVYIKLINDELYASSYDYKIQQKIRPKDEEKFKNIAESIGLYYEKIDGIWVLKNRNPNIELV
ncbi:MAG: DEAD/DEAH box helicase [Labilibaculum sp.]|nr:DEAD/DEAH box helicase [Labilibaculum sp.]MBI9060258.1 DEAD/DEAH box helicase [Labilibaculum sp.]